jgi:hypothetical protein
MLYKLAVSLKPKKLIQIEFQKNGIILSEFNQNSGSYSETLLIYLLEVCLTWRIYLSNYRLQWFLTFLCACY